MTRGLARGLLLAIAVLTFLTGLVQMIRPSLTYGLVGAEPSSPATLFMLGIVGMFMLLSGALMWATLRFPETPLGMLWCAFQKLGAAGAVGLAVMQRVFTPLALSVAAFDLATGVLALWYWRTMQRQRQ